MAFRSLNIRAKKSFSGLCSFDSVENCPSSKNTAVRYESAPRSDLPKDIEDCDLEDFGATLERCKGYPSKDSPSRRKKLFGSLRNLRSLANLHASPSKTKQTETPRPESPVKFQDHCTTPLPMSPSLALLDFKHSPTDRPMFELNMHRRSVSGSNLKVPHSSPMIVSGSARQRIPYAMFPSSNDLPAGTIPDTPGPMQKAFNRDPANRIPWQNASPTLLERYTPSTPVLTPLPGTNLSVGDVDPELVPLPPSINPSVVQVGQENPSYFDIPLDEQPQMDSTDISNGLVCLKLANDQSDPDEKELSASDKKILQVRVSHCGSSEEMRCGYKDANLQDALCAMHLPPGHIQTLRHKQQIQDLNNSVHTLSVPQHYHVLPLRPKQQDEDLQDHVWKDSIICDDCHTASDERSTTTVSEHTNDRRIPNRSHTENNPTSVSPPASQEGRKETENGSSPPVSFEYAVWDSPDESRRHARNNTWGRHTGLYDGTGYGDDDIGPAIPYEPDEGTKGTPMQSNSCSIEISQPLSVDRDCSGKQIFTNPLRGEDPNTKPVREWSPLDVNEQCEYDESLESTYHAYAYSFGARVPSSSNNSAGNDVQQPATKATEISSST